MIQRYFYHVLKSFLQNKGFGVFTLYLVGSHKLIKDFYSQYKKQTLGYLKLKGYFCDNPVTEIDLPYKGNLKNISAIINEISFDGLIIALNQDEHHCLYDIFALTEGKNIELFYYPEFLELLT